MKERLKLLVKNIIPLMGTFLLSIFGRRIERDGYEKRILIIFGGGIGDVVKRSVICSYVEKYLKDYDVYYLMPYHIQFPYAKKTIYFDYQKAKVNPLYYFTAVHALRKIGFYRVIVMFPLWDGFLPYLGIDVEPEVVFCPQESEPNSSYRSVSRIMSHLRRGSFKKIFRFVKVVSGWDKGWLLDHFPSDTWKHAYFISKVLCEISPRNTVGLDGGGLLAAKNVRTQIQLTLDKMDAVQGLNRYCVIGLGSSYAGKNWQPQKFGEAAKFLSQWGLAIVVVGGPESTKLASYFKESYGGKFINLVSKTTLDELCYVIKNSFLVIGNDTSFIHIAIAFKKPTLCIGNNALVGADTHYGYQDINRWVLSARIPEIAANDIIEELKGLLNYIGKNSDIPRKKFRTSFFDN